MTKGSEIRILNRFFYAQEITMSQAIIITNSDLQRLNKLIVAYEESAESTHDSEYIDTLKIELAKAEIVDSKEMPTDVITMNSRVEIEDLGLKRLLEYTLVFPEEANSTDRKVSILAPLGTALIGYRVGDTIEFNAPAGIRRIRVVKIIYQPEAAGDVIA
jgi:regulator of nucleoside diphosphate kinase